MFVFEGLFPRNQWKTVHLWWVRVVCLNGCQLAIVWWIAPIADTVFQRSREMNGDHALWIQVIVGYVCLTFVYYWWHRARHQWPWLWRWFHQIHHSPVRLELVTSFYKHPLEILVNALLTSFILNMCLGVSQNAIALCVLLTGLAELFYHWNIKTPYWLGFLIQRPESHCVHHQLESMGVNFSDLPVWDMVFGTFVNPKDTHFKCGFKYNQESKLHKMLFGKNVHR